MSNRSNEGETEQIVRRLKLLIFGIVIVPIVLLCAYLEYRFRSIENANPYTVPSRLDESRTVLDVLPWHPVQGQRLYVPAYSHVYHRQGEPYLLTVTLNIRNTDMEHEIVVSSVRYFDTGGKEIRSLLEKPVRLAPLAATEYVIGRDDRMGGSGASFIVEWQAGAEVTQPIVETVNIDTSATQGISFVVPAVVLFEGVESEDAPAKQTE